MVFCRVAKWVGDDVDGVNLRIKKASIGFCEGSVSFKKELERENGISLSTSLAMSTPQCNEGVALPLG